ncbi:AraC family transcriptional regulator [Neobacillus sp. Marseille-QA0830]
MYKTELENYLESFQLGPINQEKVLNEYKPMIVEVNGEPVFLFNRTFDITDSPIDENVSISMQPYESEIPLHMHDYIEMMFVYRGNCELTIKGEKITLRKGELILINHEVPHKVASITKDDIVINMILKQDYLSPAFLRRLSQKSIISQFMIESLVSHRKNNQFLIFRPKEHTKVTEIMENIMCEFFDRDFGSKEIIDSYLIVLFSTLIRYNHNQTKNETINQPFISLVAFLKYIEDHYRDCSLVQMAKTFGFNPSYLSTLLKKGTGKSFKELLQIQRLNQAALFLANTDIAIPEIAEEVGYSSVTFFYKKFKELFQDTPNSYRERHQTSIKILHK